MRSLRAFLPALLLAGPLPWSGAASAQSCTASSATIDFGTVAVPVPQVDVAAPVTLQCSGPPNQDLRVCLGLRASGPRRMSQGPDRIDYALFTDAARSQPWLAGRDGRMVGVTLGAGGQGSVVVDVYARMPAAGSPPGGLYAGAAEVIEGSFHNGNSCNSVASPGSFAGGVLEARVVVGGNCLLEVDPLLDFGTVLGTIAAPVDAAIELRATCNAGLPYAVALGDGQHAAAGQRRMHDGAGGHVAYDLFLDAGRTRRWGDGSPDPQRNGTGTGSPQALTIHGRVPAGQSVPAGTYRDVVTATITY